jgi:hypothetical protein
VNLRMIRGELRHEAVNCSEGQEAVIVARTLASAWPKAKEGNPKTHDQTQDTRNEIRLSI